MRYGCEDKEQAEMENSNCQVRYDRSDIGFQFSCAPNTAALCLKGFHVPIYCLSGFGPEPGDQRKKTESDGGAKSGDQYVVGRALIIPGSHLCGYGT